ncbi:MAG: SpoIIE family protein phosphatase [Acidimicrobiaceae bacterium]|nr:SpoIIE family protein phosphatase [Acidimicrobiaceae bacterium]
MIGAEREARELRLSDLQALTDAGLVTLGLEAFLVELLDRVRAILGADTAAVLLVDEDTEELVARAACGIEEEVRQGVRIPIGTGFAGQIAQHRRPFVIDRVDATTVTNPLLWERGIKTMLGVPLMGSNKVLGVLHVGRLRPEPFNEEDTEVLLVVAERVSGAIQNRRLAAEQAATTLLERSLLPSQLPKLEELAFAARYVPAEGRVVGGDWYDVFTLPSGRLWCIVGDVAGHGLNAAVVMGRVRSALRAYALLGSDAEELLDLVDRKVQHFEVGSMVTLLCVCSDPPYTSLRVASAGHLPPVLAEPGRPARFVEFEPGTPLGTMPDEWRRAVDVDLEPGSTLLLYTDGLIERRDESIDEGMSRLLTAVAPTEPEAVCREVMHSLIGNYAPRDDIAIVAVKRR